MSQSAIETRTVREILKLTFSIPDFQRRYRWTSDQINQLLYDIDRFSRESDENQSYYLQPLVVTEQAEGSYSIIDGQQRITTITMIIKQLNERYKEGYKIPYKEIYSERTREIDEWHKEKGEEAIKNWILEHKENLNRFEQTLLDKTRFIWHELEESEDQIKVFLRLNAGKIPFTREDRIKALFLRSFGPIANVKEFQSKIAYEWVVMENTLQDEKFWRFISPTIDYENRIGILFDIAPYSCDKDKEYEYLKNRLLSDTNEDPQKALEECWTPVKESYDQIMSWYRDTENYHYIGFLLSVKNETTELRKLIYDARTMGSNDFKQSLEARIRDALGVSCEDLKDEEVYENLKRKLRSILLLFNIVSITDSENPDERFDFSKFHNDKWDVEHIRSQADFQDEMTPEKAKEFAKYINEYFCNPSGSLALNEEDSLCEIAKKITQTKTPKAEMIEEFKKLLKDSNSRTYFDQKPMKHGLGNLALLNAEINRSYKDAFFALKRQRILDESKKGLFIPLCTRLVFQKAFSSNPKDLLEWTEDDAKEYRDHLIDKIKEFLT